MTASELISILSALPPDTPIYTYDSEWQVIEPAILRSATFDIRIAPRTNNCGQPTPNHDAHETYDTEPPYTGYERRLIHVFT